MNDLKKTEHYSKNPLLLDNLTDFIPSIAKIVEPFYGNGDLVKNFNISEYYDINLEGVHKRDTLLSPPDYQGKWIITNPPYLAKNKVKEKKYFLNNDYDDLYKVALSTMLQAEGGILVIPINFFSDSRSNKIRNIFLSKFKIERINYFEEQVFEKTAYNVCSFAFRKHLGNNIQRIPFVIYNSEDKTEETEMILKKEYNYRFGGDFFSKLAGVKNVFSRITENNSKNPTKINIVCIDKKNEPLHFYYSEKPYYGKDSDRNIATLSCDYDLEDNLQKEIIKEANSVIQKVREEYNNIILTNFRDRNRKRISFQEAYQIASLAFWEVYN